MDSETPAPVPTPDPAPAPGRLIVFGAGVTRTFAALKAALYAALASVLIGLGVSAWLAGAVSRWLTASLDAAPGTGFSLVDTFSMFIGSHLVTVQSRSHAAFLSVNVTLRAGLIILLLVPLISVLLGTTLFTWRFRTRARLSPAVYAGMTGMLYATALALIALFTHASFVEALASGLILGTLFAMPGAFLGFRKKRPKPADTTPTVVPAAQSDAPPEAQADAPPTAAEAPAAGLATVRSSLPAFVLGAESLAFELLGLTILSLLIFTIDGSLARSLLLLPNLGVYAMAFVHGATISVLSNLQRIGSLSFSLLHGLRGAGDELAAYGPYRFLLLLIPLAVLVAGGFVLERRRKTGRLGAAVAFAAGYGALGALLTWACSITLDATGAAVSLLSDSGVVNILIGAPWAVTLLLMVPAAALGSYIGSSLAGGHKLAARPTAIVAAVLVIACIFGGIWAAPRILPTLAGLGSHVATFSVPLPDLQQGTAVTELADGAFIVAGYAVSGPGLPLVVAVDATGAKLWAQPVDLSPLAGAADPVNPPAVAPPVLRSLTATRPASNGAPPVETVYHFTVRLVAALPNGDIALAGTRFGSLQPQPDRFTLQSAGPAPTSEDAYVARLDSQGRPLWVAVWRDAALSPSGPVSLDPLSDGGLKLVVRAGPLGQRKLAELLVSPAGALSLTATGETNAVAGLGPDTPTIPALTDRQCLPLAATPLPNGGKIACGSMNSATGGPNGGSGRQRAFLALVDRDGKVRWLRSSESTDMPSLSAARPTRDGGFLAVGVRGTGAWLIKTDGRGLLREEKTWK